MSDSMTREGDLVLIHYQKQPALFARVEAIEPDVKKDWFQVTLLLLSIPPHTVTWILREEYINGAEFTMGGVPMTMETVHRTVKKIPKSEGEAGGVAGSGGKVIPFNFKKI
jgi:hypothetical protein